MRLWDRFAVLAVCEALFSHQRAISSATFSAVSCSISPGTTQAASLPLPTTVIPERYETPITQIHETPITQIRSAAYPGWATGLDHAFACGFASAGKMKACLAAREKMVSQSAKCGGCKVFTLGEPAGRGGLGDDLCLKNK